jgi:tetratricopeptide (TPR) repeat protein
MKFRNLAVSFAGLLFVAITSFAQITAVEGVVKGLDGKPLQGAVIQFLRLDIKGTYKVKTDKKGHYIYNGLPVGTFTLSCEVDGKEVDKVANVKTRPGDPLVMDFDLAKANGGDAAMQAALQKGEITKDLERQLTPDQKKALEDQIKKREGDIKKNAALNESYSAGKTALDAGQYDVAVEDFNKAAAIADTENNKLAVYSNLADALSKLAKTKTGPEFDTDMQKCVEAYGQALALKPDDAGMHNNYGLALAQAKKFAEAQAELEKAAQLEPQGAGKYYYNLGATEINAGQNGPASEAFKKAIAAVPPYPDAYYQYGVTLVSQAQMGADGKVTPVPGTVEAFQKYLELSPNGQFAQQAKDMLTTLGGNIQTEYQNPNAKKTAKTKK